MKLSSQNARFYVAWSSPGGTRSDWSLEQRTNTRFCATETLQMLTETYGADAMKKSSVSEWHKRLKEGRGDVEDSFWSQGHCSLSVSSTRSNNEPA